MSARWSLSTFALLGTLTLLGCPSESDNNDGASDGTSSADTSGTTGDDSETSGGSEAGCPIGAEGCPCTADGACNSGLMCDGGVCSTGCEPGTEGCSCDAGACDAGLTCMLDQCVPGSGDGDGDPTGGGELMCDELSMECTGLDQDACVCETCKDDGMCTEDEDCVCPDCTNEEFCNDAEACVLDGLCHPYYESCQCADCAAHPSC